MLGRPNRAGFGRVTSKKPVNNAWFEEEKSQLLASSTESEMTPHIAETQPLSSNISPASYLFGVKDEAPTVAHATLPSFIPLHSAVSLEDVMIVEGREFLSNLSSNKSTARGKLSLDKRQDREMETLSDEEVEDDVKDETAQKWELEILRAGLRNGNPNSQIKKLNSRDPSLLPNWGATETMKVEAPTIADALDAVEVKTKGLKEQLEKTNKKLATVRDEEYPVTKSRIVELDDKIDSWKNAETFLRNLFRNMKVWYANRSELVPRSLKLVLQIRNFRTMHFGDRREREIKLGMTWVLESPSLRDTNSSSLIPLDAEQTDEFGRHIDYARGVEQRTIQRQMTNELYNLSDLISRTFSVCHVEWCGRDETDANTAELEEYLEWKNYANRCVEDWTPPLKEVIPWIYSWNQTNSVSFEGLSGMRSAADFCSSCFFVVCELYSPLSDNCAHFVEYFANLVDTICSVVDFRAEENNKVWKRRLTLEIIKRALLPRIEYDILYAWGFFGKVMARGREVVSRTIEWMKECNASEEEINRTHVTVGNILYVGFLADITHYCVYPEYNDLFGKYNDIDASAAFFMNLENEKRLCSAVGYPIEIAVRIFVAICEWTESIKLMKGVRLCLEHVWIERMARPLTQFPFPSFFVLHILEQIVRSIRTSWSLVRAQHEPYWSSAMSLLKGCAEKLALVGDAQWNTDFGRMSLYWTASEAALHDYHWSDLTHLYHPLNRLDHLNAKLHLLANG